MGFSYEDWSGPFYPLAMKSGDWLEWYSRHFNAVELDTTFYAAPTPERVARWAAVSPDDFRFCLKTPRAITHDSPLVSGVLQMQQFIDVCRGFGEKLGAILIQFAPSFMADQFRALTDFLETLPADVSIAVELRHRSWGTPDTLKMLHDRRCAFVSAEYSTRPARVFSTAEFLYIHPLGGRAPSVPSIRTGTDRPNRAPCLVARGPYSDDRQSQAGIRLLQQRLRGICHRDGEPIQASGRPAGARGKDHANTEFV